MIRMKERITRINDLLKAWELNKNSWNMVDLFNTDEITVNQIEDFLDDATNEHNYHYDFLFQMIIDTKKDHISYGDIIQDIKNVLRFAYANNEKYLSFLRRYLRCFCAFMIIYTKSTDGSQLLASTLNADTIKYFLNDNPQDGDYVNYYYRGQTNYEWELIPSLFRNYNFRNGDQGDYIDSNMILNIYDNEELVDKYDKTIGTSSRGGKVSLKTTGITYNFLSYMQHSVSFSPMIDFTDKKEIASTFALGNKTDFNSFLKYDSAIFKLGITKEKENELENEKDINNFFQKEYNIKVLNGKLKLGTRMMVAKNDYSTVEIDCTSIKCIIKELKPEYKVINLATNDRMKYQHGKFLVFYNCIIVNGRIFFNLNRDISIEKIKISKKTKKRFYNYLVKEYDYYNMEYLMNPYLYFSK